MSRAIGAVLLLGVAAFLIACALVLFVFKPCWSWINQLDSTYVCTGSLTPSPSSSSSSSPTSVPVSTCVYNTSTQDWNSGCAVKIVTAGPSYSLYKCSDSQCQTDPVEIMSFESIYNGNTVNFQGTGVVPFETYLSIDKQTGVVIPMWQFSTLTVNNTGSVDLPEFSE